MPGVGRRRPTRRCRSTTRPGSTPSRRVLHLAHGLYRWRTGARHPVQRATRARRGAGTIDQAAPFHDSIRPRSARSPRRAPHRRTGGRTRSTTRRPAGSRHRRPGWARPSRRAVPRLDQGRLGLRRVTRRPTAMHAAADTHDTAASESRTVPGLGLATTDQAVPSHDSPASAGPRGRGSCADGHAVGEVRQSTPLRPLSARQAPPTGHRTAAPTAASVRTRDRVGPPVRAAAHWAVNGGAVVTSGRVGPPPEPPPRRCRPVPSARGRPRPARSPRGGCGAAATAVSCPWLQAPPSRPPCLGPNGRVHVRPAAIPPWALRLYPGPPPGGHSRWTWPADRPGRRARPREV